MRDLGRLRYIAGHHRDLRGLGVVPFGLWFLVVAVGESGYDTTGWMPLWGIAFLYLGFPVMAFVAWALAGVFYDRRFGSTLDYGSRPTDVPRWTRGAFLALGLCAALFSPPVALFGSALAAVLFFTGRPQAALGYHHRTVLAALVVAATLCVVVLGATDAAPVAEVRKSVDLAMMGTVLLVGGLFDHLLLVRSMKALPREGDAGTV